MTHPRHRVTNAHTETSWPEQSQSAAFTSMSLACALSPGVTYRVESLHEERGWLEIAVLTNITIEGVAT